MDGIQFLQYRLHIVFRLCSRRSCVALLVMKRSVHFERCGVAIMARSAGAAVQFAGSHGDLPGRYGLLSPKTLLMQHVMVRRTTH